MTFALDPGPLGPAFDHACRRLEQARFCDALWSRRADLWSSDREVQRRIARRLGWLDVVDAMRAHVPRLRDLGQSAAHAGFSDVVLIGMGGSSLAGDVLRASVGAAPGFPRFQVLDSVDPDAVRAAMARAATTLFVLASKSGSTIEVTTLAAEAERRLEDAGIANAGSHLLAITDDNTELHRRAIARRFRGVFVNPSDIGGRFSALSLFGLVPAALMGIDVEALLASAQAMAGECRATDPRQNPGLALGAVMGAAAAAGRDKLTLLMPESLGRFGLWAEQLVAESTGKNGTGLVPIVGDLSDAGRAGDRAIAAIVMDGGDDPAPAARARAAGVPVVTLSMPGPLALGGEFFRWEVATAAAGWLLGVNPFDEPNVQQAKDATHALLDVFTTGGRWPVAEPDALVDGARIRLTAAAKDGIGRLHPGDYFGLLAYLPEDRRFGPTLERIRAGVADRTGCATMLGYGPRYLHSTGQLHKGGPDSGVFLIVTAEPDPDLPIPGAPYSFGVLEMAQALGDFESLDGAGRRAAHVHLPRRDPVLLQWVADKMLSVG
ncbi:MAG: glucose-6-phosphate isomerase [Acidobacteria bacterium]|nr:glucose-6-phosphate isomerase [Acidobacteriota bacterium]